MRAKSKFFNYDKALKNSKIQPKHKDKNRAEKFIYTCIILSYLKQSKHISNHQMKQLD